MTAPLTPWLLFDDVAAGDALPVLEYDVSATTVVLGALALIDRRVGQRSAPRCAN